MTELVNRLTWLLLLSCSERNFLQRELFWYSSLLMIHNRVTSCQHVMTANRGTEKSAYFKLSQTTQNMGSYSAGSSKGDFGLSYTVDMFWQQHKKTGAEEWAAHNEPLTKSWCELQHGLWAQVAPAQMKEILHCMATSFCPWWLLRCTENNTIQQIKGRWGSWAFPNVELQIVVAE